jgi:hypothetical protein
MCDRLALFGAIIQRAYIILNFAAIIHILFYYHMDGLFLFESLLLFSYIRVSSILCLFSHEFLNLNVLLSVSSVCYVL